MNQSKQDTTLTEKIEPIIYNAIYDGMNEVDDRQDVQHTVDKTVQSILSLLEEEVRKAGIDMQDLLQQEYEKEKDKKIIASQRCKFAKENETIGESRTRHSGFLSGLLYARDRIKELSKEKK